MFRNVLFILPLFLILGSCEKEQQENAEVLADQTLEMINVETRSGPSGCFELIFPLSLEMPDGTILEVTSHEDAKAQIIAWKSENPDVKGRPHLVFPIDLIDADGNLISVESKEELREIIKECKKDFIANHDKPCFKLQFPVSIEFPNGTIVSFDDRKELKMVLRKWKKDHPFAQERPKLVFPVTVIMKEDGTLVTLESKEALIALKEACE
jgi:hypothetical protein